MARAVFIIRKRPQQNCAGCHMPLKESQDFGANFFNPTNTSTRYIHNHLFPAANTGIAFLRESTRDRSKSKRLILKGTVRVDIFGVKEGGAIDAPLTAPLRPKIPALKPGGKYLLEVGLAHDEAGHPFTQGTVDSNEVWVDAKVTSGDKIVGRSGGLGQHNEVDPWSHFVNVYMLDRDGNRIDRRNPQDIFTPLYNHQIPPGRGAGGALRIHCAGRSKRAADGRGQAAISKVRHDLHELRFRHELTKGRRSPSRTTCRS